MSEKEQISTAIAGDGKSVRIHIGPHGSDAPAIQLNADQLVGLIRHLAGIRARMKPPILHQIEETVGGGDLFNTLQSPNWRIAGQPMGGNRVLMFRHPGLGWVVYLLDQGNADQIAKWLTISTSDLLANPQGRA